MCYLHAHVYITRAPTKQILPGQMFTVAKAAIENGRFKSTAKM